VVFPDQKPKTVPNLVKFILHYANFTLQVDVAVNTCADECVTRNRELILKRIEELKTSIAQLSRRGQMIALQTPKDETQKSLLETSRRGIIRARNVKSFKLRKAQILSSYLQSNWKQLDKQMIYEYIQSSLGL